MVAIAHVKSFWQPLSVLPYGVICHSTFGLYIMQSWLVEQSRLFECRGTRLSSTLLNQALPRTLNERRNASLWPSALTRVTGQPDRETNLGTALSRLCTTTWERNFWIMDFQGLMHVFLLVSGSPLATAVLDWSLWNHPRWSNWYVLPINQEMHVGTKTAALKPRIWKVVQVSTITPLMRLSDADCPRI